MCGAREVRSPCAWRGGAQPGTFLCGLPASHTDDSAATRPEPIKSSGAKCGLVAFHQISISSYSSPSLPFFQQADTSQKETGCQACGGLELHKPSCRGWKAEELHSSPSPSAVLNVKKPGHRRQGIPSGLREGASCIDGMFPNIRIDGSPPGSPVPGILQARTLEWVAISFSNA